MSAITGELARQGFAVRPNLPADHVATVDVQRGIRASALPSRPPVTVGVGGGTFRDGLCIGLGPSFGLGGKKSRDTAVPPLSVQITRASDARAVWEGPQAGPPDTQTSHGAAA